MSWQLIEQFLLSTFICSNTSGAEAAKQRHPSGRDISPPPPLCLSGSGVAHPAEEGRSDPQQIA